MKKCLYKSLVVLAVASNSFFPLALAQEQVPTTEEQSIQKDQEVINLLTGEVYSIDTKKLNRVAVANPDVVDISDAKPEKVLIVGKKPGQTDLFVWDDNGKRDMIVRVASENLDTIKLRVQEVLDKAQIKGVALDKNLYEGKIVLSGSVTKEDKDIMDKIMDPYVDKVINLVKVDVSEDLVQIDGQIIELTASYDKTLGIDWSTGKQTIDAATGQVTTTSDFAHLQPTYLELQPRVNGKPEDFFKIGNFYRSQESALAAQVNILVTEGKGRVISKPRLVVKSGKEASFLVGGEIPITSTTATGGGAGTVTNNVEFKQYGVSMTVTPTIIEGKINMIVTVKITDIDLDNKVGSNVAYTSREAQTELLLDNTQTIVLAGLIKHNDGETVKKVAFFGDIPLIGALFRSRGTPSKDTELVIVLTPRILKNKIMAKEQVAMPTKREKAFVKEFESNFEKEPIKDLKVEAPKPVEAPRVIKEVKPTQTTLASSKVPDIIVLSYMRSIQLRISQAIAYPYEALQKNWNGTVKLRLRIRRDGVLLDCDLLESSGHDIFDTDALKTAKSLAPFLAFPKEMIQDDMVVIVPIVYQQPGVKKESQTVVASY